MKTFKPYPELFVDDVAPEEPVIRSKSGDQFVMTDIASVQRLVDCWNACRKLYSPAAHIAETDAYVARLEGLRKEAWARAEASSCADNENSPSAECVNPRMVGSAVANAGGDDVDRSVPRAPVEAGTEHTSLAGGLESGIDHSFVDENTSGPDEKRAPFSADWNHDLTQAPTDGTPVWAATKCGKVYKTHYLPPLGKHRPEGRWCFLGTKEKPIAWKPFEVPVHPGVSEQGRAA